MPCEHGWRDRVDCDQCRPFQPDWRLDAPDALAVHLRIALHRRGIDCSSMTTDEQWSDLAAEIIDGMRLDRISPMRIIEVAREWDRKD